MATDCTPVGYNVWHCFSNMVRLIILYVNILREIADAS